MKASYLKNQDDILKIVLGGRKSAIVSRKMGYKFNQVMRWMNHSKKLKWNEFVELCRVVNFPIENVLEDVFGISIQTKADCNQAFVKILLSQSLQKAKVRNAIEISRQTLYRLQKQKTYPDLTSILALIDLRPRYLSQFLETLKSRKAGATQVKIKSPFSVPWLGVVSAAMAQDAHLCLPAYSPEWIADKVKLSVAQVEAAVQVMLDNQLIVWDGKHFRPTMARTLALNHNRSRDEFLATIQFWSQKSLTAIDQQRQNNTPSQHYAGVFRTFMATKENVEQINSLIAELEEKIHNIITTTEAKKSEIRCFVFSHFDVEKTRRVGF